MTISIKENITWIDFRNPIQKSLVQATQMVRTSAIRNAPVLTGTLRRSITVDNSAIKYWTGKVWTNVPYARIREYINKKNPHTRFYMRRALQDNKQKIFEIFKRNLSQ